MNTDNNFQHLEHVNSNAVISFSNETTFKVSKLMERLNSFFVQSILSELPGKLNQAGLGTPPHHGSNWNTGRVDAEILEPKSGKWKKGKVRMRVVLEFCPDEPEELKDGSIQQVNSLDDIRQTI